MTSQVQAGTAPPAGLSFRSLVLPRLAGLADGQLTLREGGTSSTFGSPAADGLSAEVVMRHPAFLNKSMVLASRLPLGIPSFKFFIYTHPLD